MPHADEPLLVISPHLDDAVFSCGAAVAAAPDSIVCTVFAGVPHDALVTDWDTQCGFANAHQAMRARHAEDSAALDALGARPIHLGFLDSQYADDSPATRDEITTALLDVIRARAYRALAIPLGLFHSDHDLVHRACREAWLVDPSLACIAYEDALYRRMDGLVQTCLAELSGRGIIATPVSERIDTAALDRHQEAKQRAVSRYISQLKAFGPKGYDDVFAPERLWTLQPTHHDR
ncbi:LmbE family protein [Caballeronia arvi]|uniref:LmbE family protein n=1 Tax=Caballeronia arvi TaxID=1777135 RepID=A0A158L5F1_9BURK|nr:PIG-L family deacetylase [Caballeronia arvi]SAL88502.1 LmbE family protein [Caballeronia arvi]